MILKNHHTLFFGTNLHPFQFQRKKLQNNGFCTCKCCNYSKRCRLVSQALNFSNFSAQNVGFSRKDLILRNGSSLKCANELGRDFSGKKVRNFRKDLILRNGPRLKCANEKEPYFVSENLENYLRPLLKEGLLLIRASVYTAVLCGVCMLVWYGQNKAKVFVENNLLPSVCLVISEYIQRDVEFGKVRRISPLSITLEACSIGPHKEEFSCGEVPTVKIRVRPFASLRRGKVVVDAVLTQPSVLVVQKKDFTWLGIPFTEGGRERRFSSEDGIDYRTRTRRLAREEGGARWERERDEAAREAAEVGYFVSERSCGVTEGDGSKEIGTSSIELTEATPFFCVDGGKHDHRFMDTGVDYDTKHADLEKAFGVKFLGSGFRFWSRVLSGHRKNRFKRKANGSKIYASGVATKKRMFERSASAARAYFRDQSQGKDGEPASSSECFQFMNHDDVHVAVSEVDGNAKSVTIGDENISDDSQSAARSRDLGIWSPSVDGNVGGQSDYLKFVREPNLQTGENNFENLESCEDVAVPANANSRMDKIEVLVPPVEDDDFGNDNSSGGQPDFTSEILVGAKPNPQWATYFQTPFESLLVKFGLTSFMRNMEESISCFLSGPIEKLKSDASVKVEDIIAEPVDGLDFVQSEGINKTLPVILDSVHFKGATVMLLAYGDGEVR